MYNKIKLILNSINGGIKILNVGFDNLCNCNNIYCEKRFIKHVDSR